MNEPRKVKCILFTIVISNKVEWLHVFLVIAKKEAINQLMTFFIPRLFYWKSFFRVEWKVFYQNTCFPKIIKVKLILESSLNNFLHLASIELFKDIIGISFKFLQTIVVWELCFNLVDFSKHVKNRTLEKYNHYFLSFAVGFIESLIKNSFVYQRFHLLLHKY